MPHGPEEAPFRGRYAPSPTGRLHLGNARTALLCWLQARKARGTFVMRIEDIDPQRSRPEFEARILEDLRWLGLDWDEGPDVGGDYGPYRQSERGDRYAETLASLDTYPCTCTRREVREATLAPHGAEPIYPRTCVEGPTHPERPQAIRWRCPDGEVTYVDAIAGPQTETPRDEVGDFVLRRTDGAWAYQLAVTVDEAAMEITHVLRGADLLHSTARQIHLLDTYGVPRPAYAHVPLVVGPDGRKLNKRHGAPDLSALREGGAAPERVVAVLARSAGLVEDAVARIAARDLVESFDLQRVPRSDVGLDPSDLA